MHLLPGERQKLDTMLGRFIELREYCKDKLGPQRFPLFSLAPTPNSNASTPSFSYILHIVVAKMDWPQLSCPTLGWGESKLLPC